jgi:hypothetical protein
MLLVMTYIIYSRSINMARTATIQARIDPEIKSKAQDI